MGTVILPPRSIICISDDWLNRNSSFISNVFIEQLVESD